MSNFVSLSIIKGNCLKPNASEPISRTGSDAGCTVDTPCPHDCELSILRWLVHAFLQEVDNESVEIRNLQRELPSMQRRRSTVLKPNMFS